jgi:hypothetical protein
VHSFEEVLDHAVKCLRISIEVRFEAPV